jgi:hypothetical protein
VSAPIIIIIINDNMINESLQRVNLNSKLIFLNAQYKYSDNTCRIKETEKPIFECHIKKNHFYYKKAMYYFLVIAMLSAASVQGLRGLPPAKIAR